MGYWLLTSHRQVEVEAVPSQKKDEETEDAIQTNEKRFRKEAKSYKQNCFDRKFNFISSKCRVKFFWFSFRKPN